MMEMKNLNAFEKIDFVFQPIIDIKSNRIYGYEALLRNYEYLGYKTVFEFFDDYFSQNLLYQLDLFLREKLITLFVQTPEFQKRRIFYNIDNRILEMPDYYPGNTLRLLQKFKVSNSSIIFEISERIPFQSYDEIRKIIENYQKQGFKIAIDDFGIGYSSLQLLYLAQPDIIKIDKFFISNIHKEIKKKIFLEQVINIAKINGSLITAEGIETEGEFQICKELGFDLLQGFYISKPLSLLDLEYEVNKIQDRFEDLKKNNEYSFYKNDNILLSSLEIVKIPPLKINMNFEQVLNHLKQHPDFSLYPVINDLDEPIGFLEEKVLKQYSLSLYGRDLLKYKEFKEFIFQNLIKTIILDENTNIQTFIDIFLENENFQERYTFDIILTSERKYKGIVPSYAIVKILFAKRLMLAKDENPLTNLPGNLRLQKELQSIPNFYDSLSFIYIDIVDFKPFNDFFGFEFGDQMIQFIGDYLKKFQNKHYFQAFHIGGDDFIVIIKKKKPLSILKFVLNLKKEFSKGKIEIIFNGIGLKEFYSIQFDLVYSPKELKFIKIEKGPLAKDALFEENHKIDGLVKVALAS